MLIDLEPEIGGAQIRCAASHTCGGPFFFFGQSVEDLLFFVFCHGGLGSMIEWDVWAKQLLKSP